MSRCFPYPPPGYEKKTERDDIDLLTKEKHKEKKHKKDKKDKEKGEDKDRKKDKDRSEKHKEKKERKEKHKHKKDGDKDKEKKTVDEKNIAKQLEGQNGGKPSSNHLFNGQTVESNFLQELGKRIRDEGGARDNQVFQNTEQRGANLRGSIVDSSVGNSTEGKEKSKRKREDGANVNGPRHKIEERVMETYLLNGFCGMEQRRVEVAGPVDKDVKKQEGKEKHKHRNSSDNRGDGKRDRDGEKKSKSKDKDKIKEKEKREMMEKQTKKEQLRLGECGKDIHDLSDIKPPQLLNDNIKGSVYDVKPGQRKEPEMNGFVHDDDIRPNKMPRQMPSSHLLVENGRKLELSQTSLQIALEKQLTATNYKVEGKLSSCKQILQNGKKLELHAGSIQSVSDMHGGSNNHKISKEGRNNGLMKAQPVTTYCSEKPLSTSIEVKDKFEVKKPLSTPLQAKEKVEAKKFSSTFTQAEEKVEAALKPPHPDSKYLNQILSVPEVGEWSDFDDQEWLFGGKRNNLSEEKPELGCFEVEGTRQVWAEALRMESADIIALPYVIPF
ncbi:hypothetical protein NMG60_11034476 [Bertholletia excelsa]